MKSTKIDKPVQVRSRAIGWLSSSALFIGLTIAGFWVIAQVAGGSMPRMDQRLLEPVAWAMIVTFLFSYYVLDGLRLYFVLRALDVFVKFRTIIPLVFINILFSNVTPMATGGGFAQVLYLKNAGVPVGTSAAATTIRTILAILVIFIAAPLFQFLYPSDATDSMGRLVTQTISAVALVYFLGFIVLIVRPYWIVVIVEFVLLGLRRPGFLGIERERRWCDAIRNETSSFVLAIHQFVAGNPVFSILAILSTIVFLLTLFSLPAILMLILDYEIDWVLAIGTIAVVTFLMYFAPTPGGAGFAEMVFAGLMINQISSNDLLLVVFVWRFLVIYLGMIIGVLFSARMLKFAWYSQ